ncbi:MAG: ABC-F family ATP-binding cassette domain-containing protein [Flavobacteriales bacterium]|nr:ABC-F family ATP-binding cassette domain-containing protein [Flavobacteriales bacterium]
MISLNDISYEFGGNYLYRNANWHIKPKERIGLVGKNGTGKTTLLRLITGEYELREGSISMMRGLKIGYLHQEMSETAVDKSILEVAMQAFEETLKIEEELNDLYLQMETDHSDKLLEKIGHLQEEFERQGGYQAKSQTEEILEGLGFKTSDLVRPLQEFSGGWRMRVILARMLLERPDVLMLDEPTNHLDLPSIEWLENYLQSYQGTVIVVSHDKFFLNKMVTKIVEVANLKLYVWEGNYDFFLNAKTERDELQQRQYDNQQQFIKDQEKFINRFRAKASKATAVQSRVKMLDKLDKIEQVQDDGARVNLKFDISKESGKIVMELNDITKHFGQNRILTQTDGTIVRGDKIALIGANGKGKSTLLRIIADTETFDGDRKEGFNVITSFFAQHQLQALHLDNEILQELTQHGSGLLESELRNVLGCFLFTGDDVFKPIRVLSGGEKSRVALAKTLVEKANFMLLDEPTNHLDLQSIEVLIQALQQYKGSFVLVSHDRYFVSQVANKIWWIEDEQIKEYPGDYEEYNYWKKKQETNKTNSIPAQEVVKKEKSTTNSGGQKNEDQKRTEQQKRKLENEISGLEEKLATLNNEMAVIEEDLTKPEMAKDVKRLYELSENHRLKTEKKEIVSKKIDELIEQLLELEE